MCSEVCGDNRFEIIANAKKRLIDGTNIETSEKEMDVLDSILFRMWQMEWLPGCVDTVPVVRCKDCKYFELDHFEKVDSFPVPIIVAHEICTKWSEGCKTSSEGYCFMGERKDGEQNAHL